MYRKAQKKWTFQKSKLSRHNNIKWLGLTVHKLKIQLIKDKIAEIFREEMGILVSLVAKKALVQSFANHDLSYLHYIKEELWKK